MVLENDRFNAWQALDETVQIFAQDASEKGLELVCNIGESVPKYLVGDEGRLRQILANLIGNAVKFTSCGRISVSAEQITGAPVTLLVKVKDTGIGVSAEQREQLFEAFVQADDSVTRRYGGTGLGLAIAKRFCEAMGGRIGVESEVGRGSEFWFTVVLSPGDPADKVETAAQKRGESAASPMAPLNLHVLLVEDNAVNIEVAVGTLEFFGCRVEVCTNGRAALRALDRSSYDVILMDCRMPEMDGYEATRRIRARCDGREKIPIVALTAHALAEERERCFAAGIDDYLSKPFEQAELHRLLRQVSHDPANAPSRSLAEVLE